MERELGNYRLLERVGAGGAGTIYRALVKGTERVVAIKELHAHLAADPQFLARFQREAQTAFTLQHENIVGVFDFGNAGNRYFLAMEFVEGPNLKEVLARVGRMEAGVAIALAIDILRGLEHAHECGVIHRDIKPANVMVTVGGVAKIADFSIAKANALPTMTATTGMLMGSPAYMSPEQIGGRALDARSDLFSVGVVLFETLAGVRPFDGSTYPEIFTKLLTAEPPDLQRLNPQVSSAVVDVVRRALEKDAGRRYESATEFRKALQHLGATQKLDLAKDRVARMVNDPAAFAAKSDTPTAVHALARAQAHLAQGDVVKSREAIEEAIAADPTNDEARELWQNVTGNVPSDGGRARGWTAAIAAALGALMALAVVIFRVTAPVSDVGARVITPPVAVQAPVARVAGGSAAVPAPVKPALKPPAPAQAKRVAPSTLANPEPNSVVRQSAVKRVPLPPRASAERPRVEPSRPSPSASSSNPSPASSSYLASASTPEQSGPGKLELTVRPWGYVYIDGKLLGASPIKPVRLSPGLHRIGLKHPACTGVDREVVIEPGQVARESVILNCE